MYIFTNGKNKKYRSFRCILLAFLCLTAYLVTGCTAPQEKPVRDEAELLQQFADVFSHAENTYAYFTGYGVISYADDGGMEYDGASYQKVDGMRWEDLQRDVNRYFTAEIADALLQTKVLDGHPLYLEKEGNLYRFGGYAALWSYSCAENETFEILSQNTTGATVRVTAKTNEGGTEISAFYDYAVFEYQGYVGGNIQVIGEIVNTFLKMQFSSSDG